MDWIERLFGVAPDNGDGSLELLIFVALVAVVAIGIPWRIPRARDALLQFFERLHRGRRDRRS
jgi:hypothetical protein